MFNLYRHVAPAADVDELAGRYRAGSVGYREAKDRLVDALEQAFRAPRARYDALLHDPGEIESVLEQGAARARRVRVRP